MLTSTDTMAAACADPRSYRLFFIPLLSSSFGGDWSPSNIFPSLVTSPSFEKKPLNSGDLGSSLSPSSSLSRKPKSPFDFFLEPSSSSEESPNKPILCIRRCASNSVPHEFGRFAGLPRDALLRFTLCDTISDYDACGCFSISNFILTCARQQRHTPLRRGRWPP